MTLRLWNIRLSVLILEISTMKKSLSIASRSIALSIACLMGPAVLAASLDEKAVEVLEHYCFDCHDDSSQKGNLNMEKLLREDSFDGALMFENLLTGKMPPAKKEQPEAKEKRAVLDWLAKQQRDYHQKSFRRLSRY